MSDSAACQASLSITNSWNLLKFMSIESVIPSNYLISIVPSSSWLQPFPSSGFFSNESVLHIRWPSIGGSVSASSQCSGLISFRIDWFDLLDCPRNSQESSPTPQFKSISTLTLSFLYGPTLKSILWVYFMLLDHINLSKAAMSL